MALLRILTLIAFGFLLGGFAVSQYLLWRLRADLKDALADEGSLENLAGTEVVYAPVSRELAVQLGDYSAPCRIRFLPRDTHPLLCDLQIRLEPPPYTPDEPLH